jgi:hypothetical protein
MPSNSKASKDGADQILNVAIDLFSSYGFDGVSVRRQNIWHRLVLRLAARLPRLVG